MVYGTITIHNGWSESHARLQSPAKSRPQSTKQEQQFYMIGIENTWEFTKATLQGLPGPSLTMAPEATPAKWRLNRAKPLARVKSLANQITGHDNENGRMNNASVEGHRYTWV